MVGTRKSSPLDRMWTNLVTCRVTCHGGRHVLTVHDPDAAYNAPPSDDEVTTCAHTTTDTGNRRRDRDGSTTKSAADDSIKTQPITAGLQNEATQNGGQTPTAPSRWKRLRQMLKLLCSHRTQRGSNPHQGKVVKLRNGRKLIVPEIVITAPDEDIEKLSDLQLINEGLDSEE